MEAIDYKKYGWVPEEESKDSSPSAIDYEKYGWNPGEEKESYPASLGMSPFRATKDLGELILDRIKSIPGYVGKSKTEASGLLKSLVTRPGHVVKQFARGLTDIPLNIANSNFPSNINQYLDKRLHLIPSDRTNKGILGNRIDFSPTEPINLHEKLKSFLGDAKYPGDELARGIGSNILPIGGVGKISSFLNPLKLTEKNIVKDVINAREKNKKIYNEKYNTFLNGAMNQGLGKSLKDSINSIDFDNALVNEPKKVKTRVDEFISNPNILTAHDAKKDLLKIQRKLNNKNESVGLIGNEVNQLDSVNDAIGKIESNMFTDKTGTVNQDVANAYRKLQEGYAKDVIPYTRNKSINSFLNGKKLSDELLSSLMSGEFPAQVGNQHTPLMIRRYLKKNPVKSGIIGTTALSPFAKSFYDYYKDKNQE